MDFNQQNLQTTELIFGSCAKRLKRRKMELRLTDSEIAGDNFDRKVVNRIINNTRTRNNPYLIPPGYVNLLVVNLKFTNARELFWGTPEDISFKENLFRCLLEDILSVREPTDGDNEKIRLIRKVLIDDVRYAKSIPASNYEWEDEYGEYWPISPLASVNGEKQSIYSYHNSKEIKRNAILRLFRNKRPLEMFEDFFLEENSNGENKGFGKLGKRLGDFVDNSLVPFLNNNLPGENSLGLRAYSIVGTDIANHVEWGFLNSVFESEGYGRGTSPKYEAFMLELMTAGCDYVNQLEKFQERMDELLRNGELR